MYNNDDFIEREINCSKFEISEQKECIKKFIEFYNKLKQIDIEKLTAEQENQILKNFNKCSYIERPGYLDYSPLVHRIYNLSNFDEIDFCKKLTGKDLVKKKIYIDAIFYNDYSNAHYDYYDEYRILRYSIDILCDKDFDDNKTYNIKEIQNLFYNKNIIILEVDCERSNNYYTALDKFLTYNWTSKVYESNQHIDIGDFFVKKGTVIKHDKGDVNKAFFKAEFPELYCLSYSDQKDFTHINTYRKLYPNFGKIALKDIQKMIPNEIKLRKEKIEEIKQNTKNEITKYVKEYKLYLQKELSKQDKIQENAFKTINKENVNTDEFTF